MKKYTHKQEALGYLVGFFGFALLALVILLAAWVAGCGDAESESVPAELPRVEIVCDVPVAKNRCTVLVWGAKDVEAYYGSRLAWWDYDISEDADRRLTYIDSPPAGEFSVVACNELGCVDESALLSTLAQEDDDDPIGCDKELGPCPTERSAA
jgi:hypothetical protein